MTDAWTMRRETAEEAVLGALMYHTKLPGDLIAAGLAEADFEDEINQRVFAAVRDISAEGGIAEPIAVSSRLGGFPSVADLVMLVDNAPTASELAPALLRMRSDGAG